MSQTRVNLAAAKRELAERQDEANLCMVELKHAQEIMAAGGTGPKVLSVSREKEAQRQREDRGERREKPGPRGMLCTLLALRTRVYVSSSVCLVHPTIHLPVICAVGLLVCVRVHPSIDWVQTLVNDTIIYPHSFFHLRIPGLFRSSSFSEHTKHSE